MRRLAVVLAALVTAGVVVAMMTATTAGANTGTASITCTGASYSYEDFAAEAAAHGGHGRAGAGVDRRRDRGDEGFCDQRGYCD